MKIPNLTAPLLIFTMAVAEGSPINDLASPDQITRDAAARELRATFVDTPESKWTPVLAKMQKGQSKKTIVELLGPEAKAAEGLGSGQSHSQAYRLDREWVLTCWFHNVDGGILIDRKLTNRLEHIWIAPQNDFTGTWIVYFVNGQKSHEIEYKQGKYYGRFTAYRSEGSLAYIQNYTFEGANGDDIGFHPSGTIAYRGQYRAGKQIGTWTWYEENGSVRSTQQHPG
jgi:hypothetical protein